MSQTNYPFSTSDDHNLAELESHGKSLIPPSQPVRGVVRMSVSTESQVKQINIYIYIIYILHIHGKILEVEQFGFQNLVKDS